MRKLLMAALLTATLATGAFAAEGNKENYFVKNSFESQFKNASNIQWTAGKDYMKATFVSNDVKMEAFYDLNGEMIGTSRAANLDELPVSAKRTFAKKFEGYTIKEAIRFEGTNENAFYISAENGKNSYIIKVEDSGFVTVKKA